MKNLTFYFLLPILLITAAGCASQRVASHASEPQRVENVILMIGDGMGVAHVTQLVIENGLQPIQMERAQAVGLVRTFSANNRVTDSAAAGTAIATGTKTNNSRLGRDPQGNDLKSILVRAQEQGYPTGLVVTVDMFDATPGAFYAHVHNRKSRDTITLQLLESGIDVAMGGGLQYLDTRQDGRILTEEFRKKGYNVALEPSGFKDITEGRLLAPLADKTMPYYVEGRGDYLPQATEKALEILSNNRAASGSRGFFLMVEGSMIDYAAHGNDPDKLLGETADFDRAVRVAFDYTDQNPGTLVIVTADHETGGLTIPSNKSDFTASESGVKYMFSTTGHSGSFVPLFAYGTGAQDFSRVLDNTDLSRIIARLLGITWE